MSIEEEQSKQGTQCWKIASGAYSQQQDSALIEAAMYGRKGYVHGGK